jgi:hypothetical protein
MPGLRRQRKWLVGLVVMSLVLSLGISAQAVHLFNDVPNLPANIHDATEWLANRAVTLGCAALLYCPNDFVTRAQMALFMHRLGVALTPLFIRGGLASGAWDPDATAVMCQTGDVAVTGFPRTAFGDVETSLNLAGAAEYNVQMVYSTDGGTTWSSVTPLGGTVNFHRSHATASGGWAHASHKTGPLDLDVGTTYRFGARVGRVSGTADASDSRCDIDVAIYNRNGASSPLRARGAGDSWR